MKNITSSHLLVKNIGLLNKLVLIQPFLHLAYHTTITDIVKSNKGIHHEQNVNITINETGPITTSSLLLFSDASHENLSGSGSQGTFILFFQEQSNKVSSLLWRSH